MFCLTWDKSKNEAFDGVLSRANEGIRAVAPNFGKVWNDTSHSMPFMQIAYRGMWA